MDCNCNEWDGSFRRWQEYGRNMAVRGCGGRQMPLESQFKHCCGQSRRYIRGPKRRERFIMRQHEMGTPTVVGEHVGPGGRRRGQNNRHMGGCPYGVSRVVEGGAATLENGKVWTGYIRRGQNYRHAGLARSLALISWPSLLDQSPRSPAPGSKPGRPAGVGREGRPGSATSQGLGAATRRHARD